jgi:Sec-independent protein translocase protein TatA
MSTAFYGLGWFIIACIVLSILANTKLGKAATKAYSKRSAARAKVKAAAAKEAAKAEAAAAKESAKAATKAAKGGKAGDAAAPAVAAADATTTPSLGWFEKGVAATGKGIRWADQRQRRVGARFEDWAHGKLDPRAQQLADWAAPHVEAALRWLHLNGWANRLADRKGTDAPDTTPATPAADAAPTPATPAAASGGQATPGSTPDSSATTPGGTAVLDQIRDICTRISDLGSAVHVDGPTKMGDAELVNTFAALARLGFVLASATTKFAENLDTLKNLDTRVTQLVAESGGHGAAYAAHMNAARKEYLRLYEAQRKAAAAGVRQVKDADKHFAKTA